ncbi:MAG: hypothetical protein ACI8QF_002888 [Limisphaerales bacterium]|jgi:hypothetical protein
MKLNISLIAGWFFLLFSSHAQQPETWTSADGRTITATFVKVSDDKITLETKGKQYTIPLSKLSPKSRAYALVLASPSGAKSGEAFQSLFNGKDLTGWIGGSEGHGVRDGLLISLPGKAKGSLFTEKEYDDFVLDFEFKLSEGANHGIAIRSPTTGSPSKAGFEIQILDDSAKRYAKLNPTSYHGSIHQCVAAKRGHLKLVGEWNQQQIRAEGNRITVTLNGVKIIDNADVSSYGRPSKGHIGLLGTGSDVAFRSIKIRPLGMPVKTTQGAFSKHEFDRIQSELQLDTDAAWRSIPWQTSLLKAQAKAATERKPIFIWAMNGNPLGCT